MVRQKQQKVVISTLKTAKEAKRYAKNGKRSEKVRKKRQKLLVSTLKMTKLPNYEIKIVGYFVSIS
ncbi:hypothetical protein ASG61_15380 [Bacillus sp. Leaf75]|nr:hypothetical protein ASG61_15380 [Bacillus sp. Leaf75]